MTRLVRTISFLAIALLLIVSPSSAIIFFDSDGDMIRLGGGGGGGGNVTFRSANSISVNGDPVPAPAGVVSGDQLILACANDDNAGTYTWPSGFTQDALVTSTADALALGVARKTATGSEPADYNVTHSSGSQAICIIVAISGANGTGQPHRISTGNSNASNSSPWSMTTGSFPSNTTAKSLILAIASSDVTSSADVVCTAPSGYTIPASHGDIREGFRNLCLSYQDNVAAGGTGALTTTGTAAGITSGWAAVTLALDVAP